jgi:hypothetical protein
MYLMKRSICFVEIQCGKFSVICILLLLHLSMLNKFQRTLLGYTLKFQDINKRGTHLQNGVGLIFYHFQFTQL